MGTPRARRATRRSAFAENYIGRERGGTLLKIENLDAEPVLLVALDEDLVLRIVLVGVVVGHGVEGDGEADVVGGIDDVAPGSLRGRARPEVLHARGLQILEGVVGGLLRRALGRVLLHPEEHGVDQHASLLVKSTGQSTCGGEERQSSYAPSSCL